MTGMLGPVDLLVIVVCVVAAVRLRAAGRLSRRVAIGLGALVLVTVVDLVLVWGGPWQLGSCTSSYWTVTSGGVTTSDFVLDDGCRDTAAIQPVVALGLEVAAFVAVGVAAVLTVRRSRPRASGKTA